MSSVRVLIVDNQRGVRRSLRSGLVSLEQDFEILEATSGEEALLVFASAPVDLLITGVRLAGISGLELLQRLRQRNPELKVILTAANPDARISRQALEAHANALISKPLELSELNEAIQRCLGEGEPPAQARQPGGTAKSISERLAAQCQEMGATASFVLDVSGQILAQAGDSDKAEIVKPIIPRLLEALGASSQLLQELGDSNLDDLLCFAGAKVDLFAAHLGKAHAMLVVFDSGVIGNTRARAARLVSTAVRELVAVLPEQEALEQPPQNQRVASPPSQVAADGEGVAELEAVFRQASMLRFDPQDIDEFWDTAVEQQNSGTSDALSSDQTQDGGIIEDE